MAVEVLFWFHPLVWWLGARLVSERERACDEAVIESGSDRRTYAESILKVCRLYLEPSLACTPAISGGSLRQRIEDIMTSPIALTLPLIKRGLLTLVMLAALATPVGLGMLGAAPALAQTASPIQLAQAGPPSSSAETLVIDPAVYAGYVGTYQFPHLIGYVVQHGDRLFYEGAELFPISRTQFFSQQFDVSLTFTLDAQGNATAVTWHEKNGIPWNAPRVDAATAQAFESAKQAHIQSQTPNPGSEAALRRFWAGLQAGKPDLGNMSPPVAATTRRFLGVNLALAQQLGPIRSLQFRGVYPRGEDVYDAVYQHDTLTWRIAIAPDGTIGFLSGVHGPVQSRAPQPGGEAGIRKFWASLVAGKPNYEDMGPLLANAVHEQLPQHLALAQRLGALQSLQFRGVSRTDDDVYDALYEHGNILTWSISMGADGKVMNSTHHPGPAAQ
jgi:hypothetical protein